MIFRRWDPGIYGERSNQVGLHLEVWFEETWKRYGVLARGYFSDSRRVFSQKGNTGFDRSRLLLGSSISIWILVIIKTKYQANKGMFFVYIETKSRAIGNEIRENMIRLFHTGDWKLWIRLLVFNGIPQIYASLEIIIIIASRCFGPVRKTLAHGLALEKLLWLVSLNRMQSRTRWLLHRLARSTGLERQRERGRSDVRYKVTEFLAVTELGSFRLICWTNIGSS
ncbi:BnaC07g47880D [Brassica napus]|uniref:BnaC07g47880D protein n=1 Tax=Brassica napus TaxID=3708 RepID=A0A078IMJ2_BRANA|nr:BnaC07g47880D [Brassica napus]